MIRLFFKAIAALRKAFYKPRENAEVVPEMLKRISFPNPSGVLLKRIPMANPTGELFKRPTTPPMKGDK